MGKGKGREDNIRSTKDLQVPTLLLFQELLDGSAQHHSTDLMNGRYREQWQYLLEDDDGIVDVHELSRLDAVYQILTGVSTPNMQAGTKGTHLVELAVPLAYNLLEVAP